MIEKWFDELKKVKGYEIDGVLPRSRAGMKLCEKLFGDLMINTKKPTKRHKIVGQEDKLTKYMSMKDFMDNNMDKIEKYYKKYKLHREIDAVHLLFGSITQYKPAIVKYFLEKYKPKCVIDSFAGWGNRYIACKAMDISYIGIDTNKKLIQRLKKIDGEGVREGGRGLKLFSGKYIFVEGKAEEQDYSQFDYDMVFICPPYNLIEIYEDMPEYKDKEDFIEKCLKPTIENLWNNLKSGGHFIITCPNSFLKIFVVKDAKKIEEIKYPKREMGFRKTQFEDEEKIFVFIKDEETK